MNVDAGWKRVRAVAGDWQSYVPVTVLAIALVSGVLASAGIRYGDVLGVTPFNPLYYVTNAFFHSDWGHYAGNMRIFVPFGVILTWYTSNRHVLGVAVTAHILASIIAAASGQIGVGSSSMALAVAAATLIRATGHAFSGASAESLQAMLAGVFAPLVVGFLLLVIFLGGAGTVAHVHHFFGFLYGGAIEAMYVLGNRESEERGRDIPRRIGR